MPYMPVQSMECQVHVTVCVFDVHDAIDHEGICLVLQLMPPPHLLVSLPVSY